MGSFGRDDGRGGFGGGRSGGGFSRGGRGGSFGGGSRGGFSRGPRRDFGSDQGPREMFKTTCSNCGKECEVPFRPTNGKPVYCSDCFEKMGNGGRSDSGRPERSDFRPQNNVQLDELNAKLDKIISLLEPKTSEVKEN